MASQVNRKIYTRKKRQFISQMTQQMVVDKIKMSTKINQQILSINDMSEIKKGRQISMKSYYNKNCNLIMNPFYYSQQQRQSDFIEVKQKIQQNWKQIEDIKVEIKLQNILSRNQIVNKNKTMREKNSFKTQDQDINIKRKSRKRREIFVNLQNEQNIKQQDNQNLSIKSENPIKKQHLSTQKSEILSLNNQFNFINPIFVMSHIEKYKKFSLIIKKNKQTLYNNYQLLQNQKLTPILNAYHKIGSIGSNYYINIIKEKKLLKSNDYLGKVRGNFNNNFYKIFNKGQNPDQCYNKLRWRVNIANVSFEESDKISVIKIDIPNFTNRYNFDTFRIQNKQTLNSLNSILPNSVQSFQHKKVRSDGKLGKVQNIIFEQMFPKQSVKNIPLRIKKLNYGIYQIEACYPFSIFQAFTISIAVLDNNSQ